jgi:hypothetical protein
MSVRKTTRLVEQLEAAEWIGPGKTESDGQCELWYQPEGWAKAYRFVALRYKKKPKPKEESDPEQYQLFDTPQYSYRVFVTNMNDPIWWLEWFYRQRGGAENLIKEANNDAGLAAHPSSRFETNRNYFQLAMLAYNLNCWLMLPIAARNRVQPGTRHEHRESEAHEIIDGTPALSADCGPCRVPGSQDLAACRASGYQL